MISFLRPVALTAWTNSTSSHALIDVRLMVGKHLAKVRNGRLVQAGLDVDCGVYDRPAESTAGFGDADNIVNQPLPIHGGNRIHLHWLIIDASRSSSA